MLSCCLHNNEPFLAWTVMCDEKWILYNCCQPAHCWTEKKLQSTSPSQTCTKKNVIVAVWWSAASLIQYSFPNPSEIITSEKYAQQIDETHWKLPCLQLALVNRKGPIILHDNAWLHVPQPVLQELNKLGYVVLPHPPYSPDLLSRYLDNFAVKMFPLPAGGRKCFPRVHRIPKHRSLCYRNKQTYFSWAKMCWL